MIDYNRWHNDIFYAKKNPDLLNCYKPNASESQPLRLFHGEFWDQLFNEKMLNDAMPIYIGCLLEIRPDLICTLP
jgi:hypothetical protein